MMLPSQLPSAVNQTSDSSARITVPIRCRRPIHPAKAIARASNAAVMIKRSSLIRRKPTGEVEPQTRSSRRCRIPTDRWSRLAGTCPDRPG